MLYLTFLISSRVKISGERPPWTQRNCWFMMAARGRQSNESIHTSYTASEYLILPAHMHVYMYTYMIIQCTHVHTHRMLKCNVEVEKLNQECDSDIM